MQSTDPTFDVNFRGAKCVLCCDHKLLEPFLSKGIKIPKLNRWSMELVDYNIVFAFDVYKCNVLVDTTSGCEGKYLQRITGKPETEVDNNTQQVVTEVCTTNMHTASANTPCNEQKWDKTC